MSKNTFLERVRARHAKLAAKQSSIAPPRTSAHQPAAKPAPKTPKPAAPKATAKPETKRVVVDHGGGQRETVTVTAQGPAVNVKTPAQAAAERKDAELSDAELEKLTAPDAKP